MRLVPHSRPIRRARAPRGGAGGFTLIEMIVAMGILVIGVSSILGLLSFGAALQRTAEARNEASLAAAQMVASLRDDPALFPMQPDGSVGAPAALVLERPVPGHSRLVARIELRENPLLAGEYIATVEIGWKERGKRRLETFRTILQREVPFAHRLEIEMRGSPPPVDR